MSNWTLAPSLVHLFAEIDRTWPHRHRTMDGTIGDAAHAARKSEHNPNADRSDTVPDGMVTAIDIDVNGINKPTVLRHLIGDKRVWYVISDRTIWSRTYDWARRSYTGDNPHTTHIHVSLVQDYRACIDTSPWGIEPVPPKTETPLQRVTRIAHQRLVRIRKLIRRGGK